MNIPKIIFSDKILKRLSIFMKIGGLTFFPWIILREKYRDDPRYSQKKIVTINHETIHIKQQQEMLVIFFYIWYVLEWFIKLFRYGKSAYENISFERESYANEDDLTYLNNRKLFSWVKYIFKK